MSKGNTRKVWQYIKELSGKCLTTKQISKITENGIELLDKKDIANSLNNYFATAADSVLKFSKLLENKCNNVLTL